MPISPSVNQFDTIDDISPNRLYSWEKVEA